MRQLVQVHIPKTGGTALRHALKDAPVPVPHWKHAWTMPGETSYEHSFVVTLRDPLRRFLSQYAWMRGWLKAYHKIESPDELAFRMRDDEFLGTKPARHLVFRAQSVWVHSVERLSQPDVAFVLFTETLDEDFARMCRALHWRGVSLPDPQDPNRRNSQDPYPRELTSEAEDAVRTLFKRDFEIVDEMRSRRDTT